MPTATDFLAENDPQANCTDVTVLKNEVKLLRAEAERQRKLAAVELRHAAEVSDINAAYAKRLRKAHEAALRDLSECRQRISELVKENAHLRMQRSTHGSLDTSLPQARPIEDNLRTTENGNVDSEYWEAATVQEENEVAYPFTERLEATETASSAQVHPAPASSLSTRIDTGSGKRINESSEQLKANDTTNTLQLQPSSSSSSLAARILHARKCMENIHGMPVREGGITREGKPVQEDDDWVNVKEKMYRSGWKWGKGNRSCTSCLYYLPGGKSQRQGGIHGEDFVSSEFEMRKFAFDHLGWGGDGNFMKELLEERRTLQEQPNGRRWSRRKKTQSPKYTSTKRYKL